MTTAGIRSLKLLWRKKKVSEDKLRSYVESSVITAEQYEEITGEAFTVADSDSETEG